MRYALVSDIHANLQAWKAVLLDIRSLRADAIICLGDIVGYGPDPSQVLQSVYENADYLVLGNHDAVICGKLSPSLFNDRARAIIEWTQGRLSRDAMKFLKTLPLTLDGGTFRCAHGDFSQPAAFNYVIDPQDAVPSWEALPHQLLFAGHTHNPAIFLLGQSRTPRVVEPQDFELEPEKRYLVNVGSVGQPRDGQARACYCIFDADQRSVAWRQVPFDLDAYRASLKAAGVSDEPSYFLRHDPRLGRPPLRTLLNFTPPKTPDKGVKDAVEVQTIVQLKKRVKRWKALTAILLAVTLAAAAIAGAAWWRHRMRGLILIGEGASVPIPATIRAPDTLIAAIPSGPSPAGAPIPGWRLSLGDKRNHGARVELIDGKPAFLLESQAPRDEIRLSSPPILVEPGMRLSYVLLCRKSADFRGDIAAVVSLKKRNGQEFEDIDLYSVKPPNVPRQGGWLEARQTLTLPAHAHSVEFQLRGKFKGEVAVAEVSLVRKD